MLELKVYTATWCRPCKAMKKALDKANLDIPVHYIDVEECLDIAETFAITAVPTLFLMSDNDVKYKWIGEVEIEKIQEQINKVKE